MSKPISAAYLERKLRAITGVQGSNPLPDLDSLVGLLTVETDRPEWSAPAGEIFGGLFGNAPLNAVEFSFVALVNRRGTEKLLVVERIINNTATVLELFLTAPGDVAAAAPFLAGELSNTIGNGFNRDSRNAAEVLAGSRSTGDIVAVPWLGPFARVGTGTTLGGVYDRPVVLEPGSAVIVAGAAVNVAVLASIAWYERPIEGLEVK